MPAARAVGRCALEVVRLLLRRRLRLPRRWVGSNVRFADGSSSWIYRETVVEGREAREPCTLIVRFRLRGVRGIGHILFRAESLLNTPMFAGFPGFVAKWWLAADEHGVYRGLYEWDGAARAEHYARALWWILAMVSVPGSIGYTVLVGRHRDDLVPRPRRHGRQAARGGSRSRWPDVPADVLVVHSEAENPGLPDLTSPAGRSTMTRGVPGSLVGGDSVLPATRRLARWPPTRPDPAHWPPDGCPGRPDLGGERGGAGDRLLAAARGPPRHGRGAVTAAAQDRWARGRPVHPRHGHHRADGACSRRSRTRPRASSA